MLGSKISRFSTQLLLPSASFLALGKGNAQDVLRLRSQLYDEEGGRIDVESHYLDFKYGLTENTALGLRLAIDSLSGMTPVGSHEDAPADTPLEDLEWEFQHIEDERKVAVVTLEHEINDHTLSFEYAHSTEEDYVSNTVSLKWQAELFEKNTTITAGASFGFDEVRATPFTTILDDRNKDTYELTLGVSQLINTRTILDLTLGYGHSEGYLADPYRRISQTTTRTVTTPFGSFPVTDTFTEPENRPREQDRWVAKITGRHYFPTIDAALSGSYRFFANSDNLEGHTFELKWIQQVNPKLSVTPYFRYYQQSGADYYRPTLTNSGIDGHGRNDGIGPFYSSDYRLSAFDAITYGFSASYELNDSLTLELQLERYEISGRNARTPDIFFPTANVISLGAQWTF